MGRRGRRIVLFILSILVGLTAGVAYGWVVNPVQYSDTAPDTLQVDYKADIILMIAELYQHEGDADLALTRLNFLEETSLIEIVEQSIAHAEECEYASTDIQLMEILASAVSQALSGSD